MRKQIVHNIVIGITLLSPLGIGNAQTVSSTATQINGRVPMAATAPTSVPALVPFSGAALDSKGHPLPNETTATFLIYKDQQGGEPLFTESQIITFDETGHYKVQLGAANPNGLPSDLFATGEARWLEVQIAGQQPEPRVLLASVPYALKAADAATLGGLPASAFALAGSKTAIANAASAAISPDAATTVTTTGGTANQLAKFSGATTIVNSTIYDNGTEVGIGTTAPTATLTVAGTATVNGNTTVNGQLILPAAGTATASVPYDSQFIKFTTSAYNSSTKSVVPPRFQLDAVVTGNDTPSPSATLELLASANSAAPTPTGLYFNIDGTINFAPNQTFPGADITGTVNASSYDLGGSSFANASDSTDSTFVGLSTGTSNYYSSNDTGIGYDALHANTSGYEDTALGYAALFSNTSGGTNTATGSYSLVDSTTGNDNTASGYAALFSNTTGSENTAVGSGALSNNTTGNDNAAFGFNTGLDDSVSAPINNATALGAHAAVGQSNSLVLGQTTAGSPGASYVNVGIGTATPRSALEVAVNAPSALGPVLTLTNSGQGASAIDFNTSQPAAGATYTPAARIVAYDNGASDNSVGSSGIAMQSRAGQALQNSLVVDGNGVHVPGALEARVNNSRIDHPLDPANKYLVHSSVQSSEMMNIYTGNIVTDELGLATVKLPEWFEAENGDFRYQLTVLDERFAQAVVSKEIKNGQFTIHTNASNVKVSWQITAVRQDAYAKAHPLVVEQQKPASERSFYLHPELYGQSAERQTGASHIYAQPASAVGRNFPVTPRPAANQLRLPDSKNPIHHPATSPVAQLAPK